MIKAVRRTSRPPEVQNCPQQWTPEGSKEFYRLLEVGKGYEEYAKKWLYDALKIEIISSNDDYRYDLLAIDDTTYEVKYDGKADYYKRYFIEFEQNFKASGISTTEAEYYIIVTPSKTLKIESLKILDLILDDRYDFKIGTCYRTVVTHGWLIPCYLLEKLGFVVLNIHKE